MSVTRGTGADCCAKKLAWCGGPSGPAPRSGHCARRSKAMTALPATTEKGPGIAARPHCAEYGFAGVRSTQSPKAPRFSILTHQLRRRFRSGRFRKDPHFFVRRPIPKDGLLPEGASLETRKPFRTLNFHGPSWVGLLRAAWFPWGGNRPRKGGPTLPAPLADWSGSWFSSHHRPRAALLRSPHPSPAGGDRTFRPVLTFRSLPTLRRGWDFRPDHHWNMRTNPSRAKRNLHAQPCG